MVTVLMATHNGAATLGKVLEAYCALEPPPGGWTVRIVDDGSTDGTPELVARYRDRLPLALIRQERAGKSAALNLAVECALRESAAELFVFTDDDATPEPDWLVRFDACARQRAGYAMFGGTIVPDWQSAPAPWILRQVPLGITYGITACQEGPVFAGLVWGANMAVRRCVFEAGHRFDRTVGPRAGRYAMGSETEFTRRLACHGYKAWFCAGARVAHWIRARQLTRAAILERAYRYGRGVRRQEVRDACPRILDVPRWMFARYAAETIGELRTWLARAREARFRHAWERAHLAGYIAQAWHGGGAPRVVVSSVSGALGGMEWRMAHEARILAHAGYRSSLALPAFPGVRHLATELAPVGVPVRIWAPPQFLEHWRWHRLRFVRARVDLGLRRLRPDLLHVAFCWTAYGASLLWLAQRRAIPTVISVHNAFPAATFSGWQRERMAEALRTVRGVYAVSESALTHFLGVYADLLPAGVRLAVIPNCVDAQRFLPCSLRRAAARARLGLADDALVLGCVARLAEQKQPGRLIDLARQLLPRFPRLRLLLIGDGPLGPGLRARVRAEGLGEVVCFTGHLEAVEDVLPALDLHLLLSRNEGFGIATIEAMACAVPVLATDVPGNSDVLRGSRGGLLVPPDCAPALAAEVAALLDDPQRRAAMGRCGRAEVQERFAPALMEQRVRDFYTGLLP